MLNVVDAMIVAMGFPVVFIQFHKNGFSTATISTATISTAAAIPQTAESVFIQVYGFIDTQLPGNFIGLYELRQGQIYLMIII
jgi:hypothetical protein